MINTATIAAINDATRIEEVVGDFVTLKKTGANLKACCPFHAEKTPSFTVHPARGIFKCFGCGKGGDAITFLREHKGMGYVEALRHLAAKYGIEVVETENGTDTQFPKRVKAMATAKVLQAHFCMSDDKVPGRKYWIDRGLEIQTLDDFGIGWCDGSKPDHVPNADLNEVGAINEKGNLIFYKRSTIPIHNKRGELVGWAARTVDDKPGIAKYINSPQTDIYSKSSVLFNLHRASQYIKSEQEVWIVEGYADVMAAWQIGIRNVVALCGTAITDAHVAMLKKFNGDIPLRIVLAFDNEITKEPNGDAKTYKVQVAMAYFVAIEKLVSIGEVVRMIYPKNRGRGYLKDMADLIRAGINPAECEKVDVIEDYVETKINTDDWLKKSTPVERADFTEHVARLISRVRRESLRDIYIKAFYDKLGASPRKFSDLVAKYDEKTNEVAYDILEHEYIIVKDEFRQRIPEKDEKTGEISWKYQNVKKSTITDQFGTAFIRTLPRFAKAEVRPSHTQYQRTRQIVTEFGTYNFINDYQPLKFKPKPFTLPPGFSADPFGYDYTTIPEIKNVALLFHHIFDQGNNTAGDTYLQIAWDWLAIMYLYPEKRLPAVGIVSKEEGTGKSTLINVMAKFFGDNATKIDSSRIAAKFNSLMGGKVLCYCEETKDDRGQMENILKDLITAFDIVVEKKHSDAEVMPTYCKFLFASNHPETFMKVGTQTTRFFVSEIRTIPEEKKVPNMEELCYLELPYLAWFLEQRKVKTPEEDRLWFKPMRYENEALERLRQASKDVVEQNMENLMNEVFVKCQLTMPVFYIISRYLQELMVAYAGKKYEMQTPNYFQNVAVRDLKIISGNPTKKMVPTVKIRTNTDTWEHERTSVQGRFLEFPIWKFCRPDDIVENYTRDNLNNLITNLANEADTLRRQYGDEPAAWLSQLIQLAKGAPVPVAEEIPF